MTLSTGAGSAFNSNALKLAYVGRQDLVRVVSRSGDVLTISRSATVSGRGLPHSHVVGTPIERTDLVIYSCKQNVTGLSVIGPT